MLVDNEYGTNRSTRMLVVHVDERAGVAAVAWELALHTKMEVYGDLWNYTPSG